MHIKIILISTILSALSFSLTAHAQIYKHVDANGHVTYSNVKIKGAKKIMLEPADTNFGTRGASSSKSNARKPAPTDFPNVNKKTQKDRDASRKQILQSELESEKEAFKKAKEAYAEAEAKPEVFTVKNANGTTSTRRNVNKFQEKMKPLQAAVDSHQRNIELLEKEINNLN